jgi:DNA-binding XRE family transcriptional regulator
MPDDLATRLRTKRHQDGYSLRTLGQQLGIAFSTLARIERGAGQPDPHTRLCLEHWLDPASPPPVCHCVRCRGGPARDLAARLVALEARVAHLATEQALMQGALESQAAHLQALRTLVAAWQPED